MTATIIFDRDQITDAVLLKPAKHLAHLGLDKFGLPIFQPAKRQPKRNQVTLRMGQALLLKGNKRENGKDTYLHLQPGEGLVRWTEDDANEVTS